LNSPWLLFEAGAISKAFEKSFVCPLLIDDGDLPENHPLAQFQHTRAVKADFLELVRSLNKGLERPLSSDHIQDAFDTFWPRMDARLESLPEEKPLPREPISDLDPLGFWSPHFLDGLDNRIVITEPWFFRDLSDRYYIRHFAVNDKDVHRLVETFKALHELVLNADELKPAHHYVSIGEVQARDLIYDGLRKIKQEVPISRATSFAWNEDFWDGHLILTGTSRASIGIQEFQRKEGKLFYRHCDAGVQCASEPLKEDIPGEEYRGIITRIVEPKTKHARTVIACNHGPATCLIAKHLFTDQFWPKLVEKMDLKKGERLPDRFQILLKVGLMRDHETVSGDLTIEDAKPLPLADARCR
jgi:hypothetical protein